jgi:hypothetical protein
MELSQRQIPRQMSGSGDQPDVASSLALGTEDRHRRRILVGDDRRRGGLNLGPRPGPLALACRP